MTRRLAALLLLFPFASGGARGEEALPAAATGETLFRKVDPTVVTLQHERSLGSGFIISADGYILTNGHVVQGEDDEDPRAVAKRITVILSDERKYPGVVVGHCLDPDVALVKIQPEAPLPVVEFGDSDACCAGQHCYAFGSPKGLKRTLTEGILSNVECTGMNTFSILIQTDAAINKGNSGGPLFNEKGQVLGLNTYSRTDAQNVSFAVPINVAKAMKEHYLKWGRFRRADLPTVVFEDLYEDLAQALGVSGGVLIDHVVPGSGAEAAGLKPGDVVAAVDGAAVSARNPGELRRFVWSFVTREVGARIVLRILRPRSGGAPETLEVPCVLAEAPPAPRSGYQVGEIPQALYDELGFGVQRIVPESRLAYGLPEAQGVLVSSVFDNTPARKAGLGVGATGPCDVLTAVEGEAVADPAAFRTALLSSLKAGRKQIRLTYRRQKNVVETALAPYYSLAGKRVALLVPAKDAEWADLLRDALLISGAQVVEANPAAVKAADLDALLLAGGSGAAAFRGQPALAALVRDMAKSRKVLAAVGAGSLALLEAEPALLEKKVTTVEDLADQALALKAKYTGKAVESDGKLVTTTGFDKPALRAFVQAFKAALTTP